MSRTRNAWKFALGGIVLVIALAVAATRLSFLQGAPGAQGAVRATPAPPFTGISAWIGSPPRTIESLRGKVVFVDFWTYSCINCLRTLPYNRRFYATYHPFGLEAVGVHSPEFSFEKVESNVRAAVKRLEVPYPVAMDNDMRTWRAYRNAYWPRVYLVDAKGRIRFDYAGEGNEEAIQRNIRTLLAEAGAKNLPPPVDLAAESFDPHLTPEIYAGYERGSQQDSLGNPEGFRPGEVVRYRATSDRDVRAAGTAGTFFLGGPWRASAEYVEAAGEGARVILPFYARNVFFVASASGTGARARLLLDGKPVPASLRAGGDTLTVDRSDLFTALRMPRAGTHVLTIEAEPGFRLFTFTFG